VNAPQVLARELTRRSWNQAPVKLGATADPYPPAERAYRLSRRMIEVFLAYKTPLVIDTRSHLVLDDLDLLVEYSHKLPLTVTVPVATADEGLLELLEPAAESASRRLQTVARLASAGIDTGVLMSPVFPGLTDGREQIAAIALRAAKAGARYFKAIPLTLDRNAYQGLMPFLEERFPELHQAYRTLYRGARLHPQQDARIRVLGRETAAAFNLETQDHLRANPAPAPSAQQLSLYGFSPV
jgi:DNA repair photolyase